MDITQLASRIRELEARIEHIRRTWPPFTSHIEDARLQSSIDLARDELNQLRAALASAPASAGAALAQAAPARERVVVVEPLQAAVGTNLQDIINTLTPIMNYRPANPAYAIIRQLAAEIIESERQREGQVIVNPDIADVSRLNSLYFRFRTHLLNLLSSSSVLLVEENRNIQQAIQLSNRLTIRNAESQPHSILGVWGGGRHSQNVALQSESAMTATKQALASAEEVEPNKQFKFTCDRLFLTQNDVKDADLKHVLKYINRLTTNTLANTGIKVIPIF
jgi:hypothetical protein